MQVAFCIAVYLVVEVPGFRVAALTADGYHRGTNLFAELDDGILRRILFKHPE